MPGPPAPAAERAARNARSTAPRISSAASGAHPHAAASRAAISAAVAAKRSSGGKLAAKASGPFVSAVSDIEDLILNRNPSEQRPRLPAILLDPGPEGVGRRERLLVAEALHEVQT